MQRGVVLRTESMDIFNETLELRLGPREGKILAWAS